MNINKLAENVIARRINSMLKTIQAVHGDKVDRYTILCIMCDRINATVPIAKVKLVTRENGTKYFKLSLKNELLLSYEDVTGEVTITLHQEVDCEVFDVIDQIFDHLLRWTLLTVHYSELKKYL